jgi:hypothetical protein
MDVSGLLTEFGGSQNLEDLPSADPISLVNSDLLLY